MDRDLALSEAVDHVATVIRLDDPVTEADHVRGDPSAPTLLVEYGEFECPDCGRAYHVIKQLLDEAPGEFRFVFRHFARDDVHPFSERSAVATEAAGAQGRFWEMHDFLFEHQHQLEIADLLRHATDLGLDLSAFQRDLQERVHLPKVRGQLRTAQEMGISQTPALFIDGTEYSGPITRTALLGAIRSQDRTG